MKVKNVEIVNSVESLNILAGMELPVKTSLQVAKLISKLSVPINEINSVRQGLIKKYGITFEKNEDGSTAIKSETEGNVLKFVTEIEELANLEAEIVVDKIKLPTEVDGKPLEIKPSVLVRLEKFIDVV